MAATTEAARSGAGGGRIPDAPSNLRFEYHHPGAIGVGESRPRLSWQVGAAPPGYVQQRYEVETVVDGPTAGTPRRSRVVVESAEQVFVPWPGPELQSRERATVRIRVGGEDEDWSPWSEEASVEVGLLHADDWSAEFIEARWYEDSPTGSRHHAVFPDRRPPLFRREFTVDDGFRSARLYVSAHGLAEFEINGVRVGRDALMPGWSSYANRLRYATYDVSAYLRLGLNAIGAWTGDGWYRGRIGFEGGTWDIYGDRIGVLAQLEVATNGGERITVATDSAWTASTGPILSSGIYDGETYDARLAQAGWSSPDFRRKWSPVAVRESELSILAAHDGQLVRSDDALDAVAIHERPDGRRIIDFGQNHTGRLRVKLEGPAGTRIQFRHAEVLQDSELYTRTLREAAQTDTVVLAGEPIVWEPRFTLHGYRYVEVSGWPGEIAPDAVRSLVYNTPMDRTGWFWSSDQDLQQLHDNIVWSMRSNFVDVPTDCPQRDERLGWTGDLNLFMPAGAWIHDASGMLSDWLRSVAAEQRHYGSVPWYVPFVPGNDYWDAYKPGAVWGDVAVMLPYLLFQRHGDVEILRRQYESARAWVDLVDERAGASHIWEGDWQAGDWLDPAAPPENPLASRTDPYLIATAYFARTSHLLAKTASVLGFADDAARYTALASDIRRAFVERYLEDDGLATSDTQTAYALILVFDLCPDRVPVLGRRLAQLVEEAGCVISTGFVGTPIICDALVKAGRPDLAYRLLLQRNCPSWLYPVTMGATTTWERWDSMLPDGSINPGEMTGFNHYALGAIADWLYRHVAGLNAEAPGFRVARIAPRPGGGLGSAGARHQTPYGPLEVRWSTEEGGVMIDFTVPVGVTAILDLPGTPQREFTHGTHSIELTAEDAPAIASDGGGSTHV